MNNLEAIADANEKYTTGVEYLSIATKRSGKVCPSCQKNLIRCVRGM